MSTAQMELLQLAKDGDREASERMIIENSGLIWSVAKRYFGRGVDADDLYQLGCIGFIKAVEGYDPEFGTQFSTYAVPKIAGEIRRFLRDDGMIKVSRGIKERAMTIRLARDRLSHRNGREPTVTELAAETGFTVEDIAMCETATSAYESINQESGDDGFTLESVLTSGGIEESLVETIALNEAIDRLPDREQQVIKLRYFRGFTQDKTAKILGVSQVQVSRIERKALENLRRYV